MPSRAAQGQWLRTILWPGGPARRGPASTKSLQLRMPQELLEDAPRDAV